MTLADSHYLDDLRSLRDRQEQLRAAFEAARDAMIIADDDGRWIDLNGATSTLLGGPMDQLRGRHLRDFVAAPLVAVMDDRDGGTGPTSREFEVMRADGSTRVVEYRATPNIMPGRHLSILRDVTDDREAEAQRTQLAAIVESAEDAIIGHSLDGRITTWNPAATRIYGISRSDAIGGHLARLVPPDGHAELEELLTIVASGQSISRRDSVHCRAGGAPVEISMSLAPVRNGRGRVVGGAIVAREVGAVRDLERRLRQAERLESLGRMAGGVAHDFNNLLTAIIGYTDLLLRDLAPGESLSRRDATEIRRAADRAARMTAQLLAFSRREPIHPEALDVRAVVDQMLPLLRRLIGPDVEVRVVHHGGSSWVQIDPGQMDQLLLNLVLNGRDAMPHGGTLTIETGEVELDAAYAATHPGATPGRHLRISVTDSGTGMDVATLERVFEPFFTTKPRGTGLGLATVYGVVASSGGHVSAASEMGHGTEFTVYLPQTPEPEAEPLGADVPPAAGTETVLLLEDDAAVRVLTQSVLERSGYTVLAAADPGAALTLALEHRGAIDLLVTDIVLPGMSGRQLAQQLAAIGCAERVLYISSAAGIGDGQTASESDTALLSKPFTADGLARRVRAVLDGPPR
jgi:PAS domain S-box-containing protein